MAGHLVSMARNLTYTQVAPGELQPEAEIVLITSRPKWAATPGRSIERINEIEELRVFMDSEMLRKLAEYLDERAEELDLMQRFVKIPSEVKENAQGDS